MAVAAAAAAAGPCRAVRASGVPALVAEPSARSFPILFSPISECPGVPGARERKAIGGACGLRGVARANLTRISLDQAYDARERFNCGPGHLLPVLRLHKDTKATQGTCAQPKSSCQAEDMVDLTDAAEPGAAGGDSKEMVVEAMRWGLVPSYTKGSASEALQAGFRMINARSDNLLRVHKRLLDRKRCVVVVDGFYEWLDKMRPSPAHLSPAGKERRSSVKRPFFMRAHGGGPLFLAGLYDTWRGAEGEHVAVAGAGEQQRTEAQLRTHTVITTESNRQLSWLHDRMPVILDPGQVDVWLDSARYAFESPVIQKLLEPYAGTLDCYEVSTTVNSIKNNCRDCLLPLSEFKARQQAAGIGAFFSSPLRQSAARTLPWGCDGGTAGKEREEEGKEEGGNVEQDRSCAGKRTREKEVAEAQAANTSWSHTDSSWDSGGGNSGVRDSLQEEWRGQSAESQACSKARAEAHSGDE